jgi:hypothetical protein
MLPATRFVMLAVAALASAPILAKPPTSAPAGTTGLCQDGSYSSASTKSGACSGHGGVSKWYGANIAAHEGASSGKASKAMPAKESATANTGFTGTCQDGTTTTAASRGGACSGHGGVKDWYAAPTSRASTMAAANPPAAAIPAAGGHGQVWVNKDTKVYHCPGDRWYGKTQEGSYMSEASARAQGFHADHGKACGQ